MDERHPARQRLLSYLTNTLIGTVVVFIMLVVISSAVLSAAADYSPAAVGYTLLADLIVAVVLVQESYWGETEDDDNGPANAFGWLGAILTAAFILCYINVLVGVAVALGTVAPGAWGYTVAGAYVIYDLLSVEYGIPLSITGVAGVVVSLGGRLTQFIEGMTWQELAPTALLNRQFARRPPELR